LHVYYLVSRPISRGRDARDLQSFPTRRSSDLKRREYQELVEERVRKLLVKMRWSKKPQDGKKFAAEAKQALDDEARTNTDPLDRSEEHTSELQSRENLVCRLLLEKKNRYAVYT